MKGEIVLGSMNVELDAFHGLTGTRSKKVFGYSLLSPMSNDFKKGIFSFAGLSDRWINREVKDSKYCS
jgi:hypothetical protein